jgi:hypothetical protein
VNHYLSYDSATYTNKYDSKVLLFRLNTAAGKLEKLLPWSISDGSTYDYISDLNIINGHLLASNWGTLHIARLNTNDSFTPQVAADLPSNWWFNVSRAAIDSSGKGVWMPVGDYGVEYSELK